MNVLILGATSTLSQKVAEHFAKVGANLLLVARNSQKLEQVKQHFTAISSGNVKSLIYDFTNTKDLASMIDNCWEQIGSIDVAIIAHGTLTNQERAEKDMEYLVSEFTINAESYVVAMSVLANKLEQQGRGTLAVFGSVAGDRGRPSNYLYGATKATIEAVSQGMRARLSKSNVNLLLIKPGIVRTQMTESLKNLPEKLVADPNLVSEEIHKAILTKKSVVYTPRYWALIMFIIKSIPQFVFNKLSL